MSTERATQDQLQPGIRILLGTSTAIGPGKAALLAAIAETGSIAAAARGMHMNYRRAWALVHSMNACFREPLVEASKGGAGRGGARLTATGLAVLDLYWRMERQAVAALTAEMAELRTLMAPEPPE